MSTDYPKLRPGLAASPDKRDPLHVFLWDQLRIRTEPLRITRLELTWIRMMNGKRSYRELQAETLRTTGGALVPLGDLHALVRRLDEHLFLDSRRFREFLDGPDRTPSCIGCYSENPAEIRTQLARLFTGPDGPGLPGEPGCRIAADGPLRAVLVPHIDYTRGGVTYGWGFKELVERTNASLFVIIGTSHYSAERFSLTRKNFCSPLGKVPTDQNFIDRLVREYGDGLFNDPIAHLPEHSIELEVVLLQYLLAGKRDFRIVPLVVGSFFDCVHGQTEPREKPDIARMVAALKKAEAEAGEPICYIISGDLAHIGPKFDDPEPVLEPFLRHSFERDKAILDRAENADADGYFRIVADERDQRRICGLPPTFVVLEAAKPPRGKLLHYGRYVHPEGFESVSFASVGFDW